MNTLDFQNLPSKTFDAVGVERVCGNSFSLAPQGEKAGLLCEEGNGNYRATIHFPEKANRLFFVRISHNAQKKIQLNLRVEKNANVVFVIHLAEKEEGETRFILDATIGENARLSLLFFHFSEGVSDISLRASLQEKGAKSILKSAFFGKKEAQNTITIESVANTESAQGKTEMRAALSGNATCEMHGAPILKNSAKNAQNSLRQKALLLSPNARVRAFPTLAVENDAVIAHHAFSLARLLPEDIFYCTSRGISAEDAQKLLQRSILSDMLVDIPDEALRDTLFQFSENFFEKNV